MQRIIYNIVVVTITLSLIACGDKEVTNEQADLQNETTTDARIFVSKAQFKNKIGRAHV